jgi:hypothetical protein
LLQLTVWAAVRLLVVMVNATVLHTIRGEISSAITTAILFGFITLAAYGRLLIRAIAARR